MLKSARRGLRPSEKTEDQRTAEDWFVAALRLVTEALAGINRLVQAMLGARQARRNY